MKVAIVGLEQSGKTSLFGALTRQPVRVGPGGYGGETHVGVVEVPDPRVDALVRMFQPRKQTRASVTFVDGAAAAGAAGARFAPQFLQEIRQSDAIVCVVRAFSSTSVPDPEGGLDPLRDYRALESELILADLDLVEKRLERLEKQDRSKPRGAQTGIEREVLLRMRPHLEEELPLSGLTLRPEEAEAVRHLDFVSTRPRVIVANIDEATLESGSDARLGPLQEWAARAGTPVLPICVAVEREVAQLGPEEEAAFLEAMGIEESGRSRLIRTVYNLLGLISFLTVGEDEVRAWTLERGGNALEAAGKIHSDLARGFIRAEVIHYDDLIRAGGPKEAREQGLYRLENRSYVVRDGDILNIRFSV